MPQEDNNSDNDDLPEQQQQQEGAGDEDDDCIGLEIIMTDTRTLSDLLGPTNNKPVKNPSQLKIQAYLKVTGDTLATITDIHHPARFSWLMVTEGEYRARIGYEDSIEDENNPGQLTNNPVAFVMPTIPPQPPWRDDFDSHALRMYHAKISYYRECTKYNQEGIEAIKHKFPEALVALEVTPRRLPVNITLATVRNHLLD